MEIKNLNDHCDSITLKKCVHYRLVLLFEAKNNLEK